MASNDAMLLGELLLPSVSVRERIQAMEERKDISSVGASNILTANKAVSPRSGATSPLSKVEDTKSNDSDMSASTSPTNQYTSMTRKAHKLKTDRFMRRLQNKPKVPNAEAVTKTRPAQVLAEERDQKQDDLEAIVTLDVELRRDIDPTGIPTDTASNESILDDVIDSLFQICRLSAGGTDEFTKDEVEISRSEESVATACILFGEKLTMPDEDGDEEEDVLEGRDAVETFDGCRCPNPIAVTLKESEATGNTPCLSPSTPVTQNRRFYVADPPALPRRNSWGISRDESTTPDANDTMTMLPLPQATRASLSIPTLDSPTGASTQNASTTGVRWSNEQQILAPILFGDEEGTTIS